MDDSFIFVCTALRAACRGDFERLNYVPASARASVNAFTFRFIFELAAPIGERGHQIRRLPFWEIGGNKCDASGAPVFVALPAAVPAVSIGDRKHASGKAFHAGGGL
jgi:hypothetical protein